MIPETFDAGRSAILQAAFSDPLPPMAVYATIKSLMPPATLRPETLLDDPAVSMNIPITSTENAALGMYSLQWRRVVVRAVYGDDDDLVVHIDYMIRKL